MAEKIFQGQVNYGWNLTWDAAGKYPMIAKRIFETYDDALAFTNDIEGTAIVGLVLSVVNDGKKNGVYCITSIKEDGVTESKGELTRVGDGMGNQTADNYSAAKAMATADNVGQIIYIKNNETIEEGSTDAGTYTSGPYIVTAAGTLQKLATSTASGDVTSDVQNLQTKVGNLEGIVGHESTGETDPSTGLVLATETNAENISKEIADRETAINGVVGTSGDTKDSDTIKGAKKYADSIKDGIDAYQVNEKLISENPVLNGKDIKLDDYAKAETKSAIAKTDNINVAFGKLEAGVDKNTEAITALNGSGENSVTGMINAQIGTLTVPDTVQDGKYVSAVSEEGGKVHITRTDLPNALGIKIADNDNHFKSENIEGALGEIITSLGTSGDISDEAGTAYARIAKNKENIETLQGAIAGGTHFIGVVEALPETANNGDIVAIVKEGADNNGKEYIYSKPEGAENGKWIELGDTTEEGERLTALEGKFNGEKAKTAEKADNAGTLEGSTKQNVIELARDGYETAKTAEGKYAVKATEEKVTALEATVNGTTGETQTDGLVQKVVALEGKFTEDKANVALKADDADKFGGKTYTDAKEDILNGYETAETAAGKYVAQVPGSSLVTDDEIRKLGTVKENAQENVIEKITVNNIPAEGEGKEKSVTIDSSNINVGKALNYEGTGDIVDGAVDVVLQDIYSKLNAVSGAKVSKVNGTANEVEVTTGATPTVSLKKEVSTDKTVAAGHIELASGEGGLYGLMYYDGNDTRENPNQQDQQQTE